jgi:diadenosine tetraphosphate (Ap4A) HIT family hydrolase
MTAGCLACEADPPGGVILDTGHWRVEHTFGSLGVGTLIVKPRRHVLHVGELHDDEAAELGPLLRDVSRVAQELGDADQVYVCLWSHADGVPHHIHFVVQPVRAGTTPYGPWLQVALFERGEPPDPTTAAEVAGRARRLLDPR